MFSQLTNLLSGLNAERVKNEADTRSCVHCDILSFESLCDHRIDSSICADNSVLLPGGCLGELVSKVESQGLSEAAETKETNGVY